MFEPQYVPKQMNIIISYDGAMLFPVSDERWKELGDRIGIEFKLERIAESRLKEMADSGGIEKITRDALLIMHSVRDGKYGVHTAKGLLNTGCRIIMAYAMEISGKDQDEMLEAFGYEPGKDFPFDPKEQVSFIIQGSDFSFGILAAEAWIKDYLTELAALRGGR